MSRLTLSYGGAHYLDRTEALATGSIVPDGFELKYITFESVGELFRRMAQDADLDMAEMSLSTLIMMIDRGDDRLVAVPVFPSRAFRHRQLYVHSDSGIAEPKDLIGKSIGVEEYQMTAAVWVRAFLQEDYGVSPHEINWFTGGLRSPSAKDRYQHNVPSGVSLQRIPSTSTLEVMLESGELSGLVSTDSPRAFGKPNSKVRRLFPKYREVETDYFRRTGLFPIMHTVVIRKDIYEANPWIMRPLLDAFQASKDAGYNRLRNQHSLAVSHPWIEDELDQLWSLFEADPFPYGIDANRNVVETLCRYSLDQGLSSRLVTVDELFLEDSLSWSGVH